MRVTADSSEDLTAPEDNHDSSVMTADDLKALPIFDNDYATAMSAFLDDSATATGGTGLIVDGVEANRATVSPSAVQEVRINQDPYLCAVLLAGPRSDGNHLQVRRRPLPRPIQFLLPRLCPQRAERARTVKAVRAAPHL